MKGFIGEFKGFALRGNVIDLAVAVVMGAAFGKIVTSLVANIITPFVGLLMGGINVSGLEYKIGDSVLTYGFLIQSIIDFLIVAMVIFLMVKAIRKAKEMMVEEEEKVEKKPAEPSEEVKLLREIRDSLKK